MKNDLKQILLDQETIAKRVLELGREIDRDYADEPPVLVCILKGSISFFADLMRAISLPIQIEFMSASSYYNATVSCGEVTIKNDLDDKIVGKRVLLVEDIVDSGRTLSAIKQDLLNKGAKSLKICTLLDKPYGRKTQIDVDYVGFTIPDEFVVGYGLDYAQKYRNLPYVGVLKPEIYK